MGKYAYVKIEYYIISQRSEFVNRFSKSFLFFSFSNCFDEKQRQVFSSLPLYSLTPATLLLMDDKGNRYFFCSLFSHLVAIFFRCFLSEPMQNISAATTMSANQNSGIFNISSIVSTFLFRALERFYHIDLLISSCHHKPYEQGYAEGQRDADNIGQKSYRNT